MSDYTGDVPDDAMTQGQVPGDGGSGPSTEAQIIGDTDLTDIPEPSGTADPILEETGMHPIEIPADTDAI